MWAKLEFFGWCALAAVATARVGWEYGPVVYAVALVAR